jgi:hypothetical protein
VREDGAAVREDDAEPEVLDDDTLALEEGAVVALAVKELAPFVWRTFPEEHVELSEDGTMATSFSEADAYAHVTTGVELTEGRHYWEVEVLSEDMDNIFVGITRPNLDLVGIYILRHCTDGWFTNAGIGWLCGNGTSFSDGAGPYKKGDRIGVLLDLNNGSLLFFKNGVQHGPGYPAGSVTGPVVAAVELGCEGHAVQLHAPVAFPAGHVQ